MRVQHCEITSKCASNWQAQKLLCQRNQGLVLLAGDPAEMHTQILHMWQQFLQDQCCIVCICASGRTSTRSSCLKRVIDSVHTAFKLVQRLMVVKQQLELLLVDVHEVVYRLTHLPDLGLQAESTLGPSDACKPVKHKAVGTRALLLVDGHQPASRHRFTDLSRIGCIAAACCVGVVEVHVHAT